MFDFAFMYQASVIAEAFLYKRILKHFQDFSWLCKTQFFSKNSLSVRI